MIWLDACRQLLLAPSQVKWSRPPIRRVSRSKEHDVSLLAFLQMAVTVLLALLLAPFLQEYRLEFTPQFWFALGYLSILATLAAFYLQTRYQKQTKTVE